MARKFERKKHEFTRAKKKILNITERSLSIVLSKNRYIPLYSLSDWSQSQENIYIIASISAWLPMPDIYGKYLYLNGRNFS